jgi:phosphatidate cytidylyltransferase
VLTAAIGLPVLIVLIWIGGWPFAIAAAIITALAITEFVHGFLVPSLPWSEATRHAPIALAGAIGVLLSHTLWWAIVAIAAFGVGLYLLGMLPVNSLGPRKPFRIQGAALLYVGLPLSTLVLIRDADDGLAWIFLILLATFAVDTGAYAVGRAIGRHKMAPSISPGKTWEGAVGGYAAGAAATVALALAFDLDDVEAWQIAGLAVLLPPGAIIGDLVESKLKRTMGIKDASGLLPGHGGFLDRLDSIIVVSLLAGLLRLTVG